MLDGLVEGAQGSIGAQQHFVHVRHQIGVLIHVCGALGFLSFFPFFFFFSFFYILQTQHVDLMAEAL
jgi:hypothetical protein